MTQTRTAASAARTLFAALTLAVGAGCAPAAETVGPTRFAAPAGNETASTAGPTVTLDAVDDPAAAAAAAAAVDAAAVAPLAAGPLAAPAVEPTLAGIDVSKWQPSVDWRQVAAAGYTFAYVAAVGSYGENPHFRQQWDGAGAAGLYRGAYYFGDPTKGTGQTHADQLLRHLGDVRDTRTLPPMLDVERHPYQVACNGVAPAVWVNYVRSFVTEVRARLGVNPVIYSTIHFWRDCLGDTRAFAGAASLFAAQWEVAAPDVFGGWPRVTFWQHSSTGQVPGIAGSTDLDVFHGTLADLRAMTVPAR